jgi:hypothetical protein
MAHNVALSPVAPVAAAAAKVDVPTFTKANYIAATASMSVACLAIDKAEANAVAHVKTWAMATAIGLKVKALDMDTVKTMIVQSVSLAKRKAIVAAKGDGTSLDAIKACGPTLAGNYAAMNRIFAAGALDRIIAGEAFNTVARTVDRVQAQKPKAATKAAKASTTPKDEAAPLKSDEAATQAVVSVASLAAPLIAHLDGLSVKAIKANENDIAALIAALGRVNAKIAAADKAKATATAKAPRKSAKVVAIAA